MQRSPFPVVVALLLVIPLAACASTSQGGSENAPQDVLTREQLDAVDNMNAYDAILRLKSSWIRSPRYSGLKVYLDGILQGGRSSLRTIQVKNIEEVRFLSPRQATMEYGTDHGGGALVISTRR